MRILRSVLAVILGIVAAGLLIWVVEGVGHRVYPPPEGVDFHDPQAVAAIMEEIPLGALLFVLLAWGVGTLAGGWLAALVAGRSATLYALIVGAVMLAGGIMNRVMIPHPVWFWILGVLVFLPAAWLGARLAPAGRDQGGG